MLFIWQFMCVIEEESTGEGVDEGDEAGGSNSQPGSSSQTSGSAGGLASNATRSSSIKCSFLSV